MRPPGAASLPGLRDLLNARMASAKRYARGTTHVYVGPTGLRGLLPRYADSRLGETRGNGWIAARNRPP